MSQDTYTTSGSLLPTNASDNEKALEALNEKHEWWALQDKRTLETPDAPRVIKIEQLISPDDCPEALLSYLAGGVSLDSWYVAGEKRDFSHEELKTAIHHNAKVHKQKGTASSLEQALKPTNLQYKMVEWWQDQSKDKRPATFELTVSVNQNRQQFKERANPALMRRFREIVDRVKPVRTHYTLVLSTQLDRAIVVNSKIRGKKTKTLQIQSFITLPLPKAQLNTSLIVNVPVIRGKKTLQTQSFITLPLPKVQLNTSLIVNVPVIRGKKTLQTQSFITLPLSKAQLNTSLLPVAHLFTSQVITLNKTISIPSLNIKL
jgi:phage tail P2-like protein